MSIPERSAEPPDEWEYWCEECEEPVNSDTELVEIPEGKDICFCCLDNLIEELEKLRDKGVSK